MITQYSYGQNTIASKNNNVIEKYKEWSAEEVRADLQPNRTKLVTIFENVDHNINIACAIRSNNAFLGSDVYIVGRRKYDTRGDVGCRHYQRVFHADTIKEVIEPLHAEGYIVYTVDNLEQYKPRNLFDVQFQEKTALLFGNEGYGVSQEAIDMCDGMIYIQQYGSVRSLNVACAATVTMYEYTRQWRFESV